MRHNATWTAYTGIQRKLTVSAKSPRERNDGVKQRDITRKTTRHYAWDKPTRSTLPKLPILTFVKLAFYNLACNTACSFLQNCVKHGVFGKLKLNTHLFKTENPPQTPPAGGVLSQTGTFNLTCYSLVVCVFYTGYTGVYTATCGLVGAS